MASTFGSLANTCRLGQKALTVVPPLERACGKRGDNRAGSPPPRLSYGTIQSWRRAKASGSN